MDQRLGFEVMPFQASGAASSFELEQEFRVARLAPGVRDAFAMGALAWPLAVQRAMAAGLKKLDDLTNIVFFMHHPERVRAGTGQPLRAGEPAFARLSAEWLAFRALVAPLLKGGRAPGARGAVTDFSGPASECTAALRRADKTKAQALKAINEQIGLAIEMLRKAAASLERGKRSKATRDLFLKIFRVRPEFVPTWLKRTTSIQDRGDVVRVRCARVADMLAGRTIKYFCAINGTNCPECASDEAKSAHACSSFGKHRVVCLGDSFWDAMKAGNTDRLLTVLMHEPFHIYFGVQVTEHRASAGKFGNVNCIVKFAFDLNSRTADEQINIRCQDILPRRELETGWLSA